MSELLQGMEIGALMRLFDRWVVARHMSRVAQPTDWICGASMMIRPSVLACIGGMDENYFLYFEETDFCYRAKQPRFPTWYDIWHRQSHSNQCGDSHRQLGRFDQAYYSEAPAGSTLHARHHQA
jgi:GT2 family glycosyltransferase